MADTIAVLSEVAMERSRQLTLGYTTEHDEQHGLNHLMGEAHYRLGHMGEVASLAAVRAELVKVAALAVAGIEHIDRHPDELKAEVVIPEQPAYEYGPEAIPGGEVSFMGTVMQTCPECAFPRPLNHDGPHLVATEEVIVPENPTEAQHDG